RERIDTDAFPSPGFEGLRVRLYVAVARTNVEEEAVRNAGEHGFGDPFVLADLRLVAGDSKGFAKTEADVARGRYQAATFVFVEPSLASGGPDRRHDDEHREPNSLMQSVGEHGEFRIELGGVLHYGTYMVTSRVR